MDALKKKYANFKNAYEALISAIETAEKLQKLPYDEEDLFNLLSSGVIKHFEMAYETGWKFLKEYLVSIHSIEVASPKAIFRLCYTYNIFPHKVIDELIELVDIRNFTTHVYDQVIAREVFDSIKHHGEVLGKILKITIPDNL